jgi:hypothetical protein
LVRVPTEVVKQRQQTAAYGSHTSSARALQLAIQQGGFKSLYQGFGITISREVSSISSRTVLVSIFFLLSLFFVRCVSDIPRNQGTIFAVTIPPLRKAQVSSCQATFLTIIRPTPRPHLSDLWKYSWCNSSCVDNPSGCNQDAHHAHKTKTRRPDRNPGKLCPRLSRRGMASFVERHCAANNLDRTRRGCISRCIRSLHPTAWKYNLTC